MSFRVSPPSHQTVLVIGAGIGGLSTGIRFKRHLGFNDVTILEESPDIGGTWSLNTYPGCSSDILIHFYSLSTDLNPYWKKTHASQPELKAYWQGLATKYSLYPQIVVNTRVLSVEWDVAAQMYHVSIQDVRTGKTRTITANIVISGIGFLARPRYPADIKGLSDFKGEIFHSARWRHDLNLSGKRVAVIGNGSSASQFIPIISEDHTTRVVNFCRTPGWMMNMPHITYSERTKWIFAHIPGVMRLYRNSIMLLADCFYIFWLNQASSAWLARYLGKWMRDSSPPEYRDKIVPNYPPGCKRTVVGSYYLPSLHRKNVKLNWDGIEEVTETGVTTKTGENLPFDVIILATGYTTDEYPIPVRGIDGQTIQEYYASKGGPAAYRGTAIPGFPNYWIISGPNTVTGHGSTMFTTECQVNYSVDLSEPVIKGKATSLSATDSATDAFNERTQAKLARTVYPQCSSWYRAGGDGKISNPFPGTNIQFWWMLRTPIWGDYNIAGGKWWMWQRRIEKVAKVLALLGLFAGLRWASVPANHGVLTQLWATYGNKMSLPGLWQTATDYLAKL